MSKVPAADPLLGFVLDFCNTYDLLEDPPDRLSIPLFDRVAAHHGLPAFGLRPADLEPVREVRNHLYAVFAADSTEAQVDRLNQLFITHHAVARLVLDEPVRMVATGGKGVARLAVLAADALARVIADGSADRLRTCAGDPCRCVYVDRTKANRQRYCCELCNDRMASAAYRRRNR
ncbi:CGNR zinc finger protein [Kribbella voronezhensis]|uniref:CGNR zinc finger protein n=1 Tax=Kribbella voronezhensis TaxID=2512212 RepID=A0A4R7TAA1_9ACTN|nr:CGNR zinc finger domain-containing protein [Kribbella voronezhensis]TDU88157.1 CGNR zinc finger protein [Kribbella voronezhensis]